MEDTLISFQVAKLAKEKGFDVPCYWYCSYKRKVPTHKQNFYPDIGTGKLENFNEDKGSFYEKFSLPTQSLLQKWLRDEYNIHIVVNFANKTQWFYDIKQIGLTSGKEYLYKSNYDFLTFEEALEKGLQEALKLINK